MSKTKQLLKSIETKEEAIKQTLNQATADDISEEGKVEMIAEIEQMIDKLENWKASLQKGTAIEKASIGAK